MRLSIQGVAASCGVAIGRAVVVGNTRGDVRRHFIAEDAIAAEIERVSRARDAVVAELEQLQKNLPPDAPQELPAMLDVHTMLLQDEEVTRGVKHWISARRYNGEWALTTQLELLVRQFEAMSDSYLRERKTDLEQVVERVLQHLRGDTKDILQLRQTALSEGTTANDNPLMLVAHDLSPADMLHFRQSIFAGFVTDVGAQTSHTAIVARSMNIPAVVGTRVASQLIHQDDIIVVDSENGMVIVDPSAKELQTYRLKQTKIASKHELLRGLRHMSPVTIDGQPIELLANIEDPDDTPTALNAGAVGVGLFRSEFLFMKRKNGLPDEEEQLQAYRNVVQGMRGLPVTIRSVDIGADKPIQETTLRAETHPNSPLGLRAIRWCLAEPEMFLTQLRAILRVATYGPVKLLLPMLAHASEVQASLLLIKQAKEQLKQRGQKFGPITIGAMIEVPAAALQTTYFLRHFDFLSIGTNDLVQYVLAIDRTDENMAYLYDPAHPAVLNLLANIIAAANAAGKPISLCGEMAGEPRFTRLLLSLGLRSFSMHPARLLAVKQAVLSCNITKSQQWAKSVLVNDNPSALLQD